MSAFDPKRTWPHPSLNGPHLNRYAAHVRSLGGGNETARFHQGHWRRGGDMASCRPIAAGRADASYRRARSLPRRTDPTINAHGRELSVEERYSELNWTEGQ